MSDAVYEDLETLLDEIRAILVRQDFNEHAAYVSSLIEMLERQDPRIRDELASVDVWGGSGALWEIELARESGDARRFAELIILLADAAIRLGVAPERPAFIADTFRGWLAQDIWTAIEKSPRMTLPPAGKPGSKESLKPKAKRKGQTES
jgi:hypothetical protein